MCHYTLHIVLLFILDGQKLAKKLSQQIGKETNTVTRLVQEHNSCCHDKTDSVPLTQRTDSIPQYCLQKR